MLGGIVRRRPCFDAREERGSARREWEPSGGFAVNVKKASLLCRPASRVRLRSFCRLWLERGAGSTTARPRIYPEPYRIRTIDEQHRPSKIQCHHAVNKATTPVVAPGLRVLLLFNCKAFSFFFFLRRIVATSTLPLPELR
jgi:hypothetical protein